MISGTSNWNSVLSVVSKAGSGNFKLPGVLSSFASEYLSIPMLVGVSMIEFKTSNLNLNLKPG